MSSQWSEHPLTAAVLRILKSHDPAGIAEAAADEYQPEAEDIAERLIRIAAQSTSAKESDTVVVERLHHWFGGVVFDRVTLSLVCLEVRAAFWNERRIVMAARALFADDVSCPWGNDAPSIMDACERAARICIPAADSAGS